MYMQDSLHMLMVCLLDKLSQVSLNVVPTPFYKIILLFYLSLTSISVLCISRSADVPSENLLPPWNVDNNND